MSSAAFTGAREYSVNANTYAKAPTSEAEV